MVELLLPFLTRVYILSLLSWLRIRITREMMLSDSATAKRSLRATPSGFSRSSAIADCVNLAAADLMFFLVSRVLLASTALPITDFMASVT